MTDILTERYKLEGINPETNAFALIDGKVYLTVAGMELKAMRSGVLAGKGAVVFGPEIDSINPHDQKDINIPTSAIATYQRLVMDQPRDFSSDPVQFHEYAKKRWHYEKPFMFLAKIARACALRHAFPDIFAGVVSYEEMQCELKFDKDIPEKSNIPAREYGPKQETTVHSGGDSLVLQSSEGCIVGGDQKLSKLSNSPKAVSAMVAAIFKQGVQS